MIHVCLFTLETWLLTRVNVVHNESIHANEERVNKKEKKENQFHSRQFNRTRTKSRVSNAISSLPPSSPVFLFFQSTTFASQVINRLAIYFLAAWNRAIRVAQNDKRKSSSPHRILTVLKTTMTLGIHPRKKRGEGNQFLFFFIAKKRFSLGQYSFHRRIS